MYRSTAQFPNSGIATYTSVSPGFDRPMDGADSDTSRVLAEKRGQIDDEIAKFKALKEKEFQDFEKDLLRQRQRRKREATKPKDASPPAYKEKVPNALSLLGVLNQSSACMNGSLARQKKSSSQDNGHPKPLAPPSKPTLSLDKLNIRGETTPPLTADGSPPSPTLCLKRQFSRSPPNYPLSLTPPRARSRKQDQAQLTPPTPSNDRTPDTFAGIFSPAYLPLLESRENGQVQKPTRPGSLALHRSSSASVSISPVARKDRALTAPLLPSNSLPSALRAASGTAMRPRKRVTFQLADRAIVEPSSSYKEGQSPMREGELDFDEKIDDVITNGNDEHESENDETNSGLATRTIRSPMLAPKEREGSKGVEQLSPRSALEVSIDGDSGVGFFELDEELASPGIQSHDAKFIDDDMEDVEKSAGLRREDEDEFNEKPRFTYEYSGSVPINISRPSGSWVGSFGH